jgi:ORF6N domain
MSQPTSPPEPTLPRIYTVRKLKVMFDTELAALFDVEAKALNQVIRRNANRFSTEEYANLKSQSAISSHATANASALRSQIVTLDTSLA